MKHSNVAATSGKYVLYLFRINSPENRRLPSNQKIPGRHPAVKAIEESIHFRLPQYTRYRDLHQLMACTTGNKERLPDEKSKDRNLKAKISSIEGLSGFEGYVD
jgi:hypothetical protein